jgi:N-acetylglucosaminyldiphosphoundecaprenol N-acetyl-beta-D-mannosaminyltransferase
VPSSERHLRQAPPLPEEPEGSPPASPGTEEVLGIPLSIVDYAGTLDWMDRMAEGGHRGYVCVAAVHTVMQSQEDEDLRRAVLSADLTVPDGQPLVWALNALGHELPDRVYGPELMARWCERASVTGRKAYLYGGKNQGALLQLALNLRQRYPGVKIVGGHAPPYRPLRDEERDTLVADINRSGADVVWVGIGVPKQEKWMAEMRNLLDVPVMVGVGAAFDFHAGLMPQAPSWMQASGLEWSYRLAKEPRRLWKRYARYNPRFAAGFLRQWGAHRRSR